MTIKQFEYKPLSHYSYAIVSNGEMAVIDPERNPEQYYEFAKTNNARIVAIIQTHPHADFVSSHLEIHKKTGATIYNSKLLGALYPHKGFDDGDTITVGNITLSAINTPGHSPDSITISATEGNETALFTGDTLFIGDVGRPDLREQVGNITAKREELAEMMFNTITNKFNDLPDDAVVYPAHGAGSLCGKNLSDAASSTLGDERRNNWAFNEKSKDGFMKVLLNGQPYIPCYFGFNVDTNKEGADDLNLCIKDIPFIENTTATGLIVDMRDDASFRNGHLKGSFNIQAVSDTSKFETWIGSIVQPHEEFTLVIDNKENKDKLLNRLSKIGYEKQVKQVITLSGEQLVKMPELDLEDFKTNPDNYTIIDIRDYSEIEEIKYFKNTLDHPLPELRDCVKSIPANKPIVVHCAGGYRSSVACSIIAKDLNGTKIFDLGPAVHQFKN